MGGKRLLVGGLLGADSEKCLGKSSLTFKELQTILIAAESVLNNRLLINMYNDKNGVTYPLPITAGTLKTVNYDS